MSVNVSVAQKQLVERLVKTGKFSNASEVVRRGLELVRQEVEREDLSPYPDAALASAYKELSKEDLEEDKKMGRACARPNPGELD